MRLTGRIVFAIRAAAELAGRDEHVPLDQIAQREIFPADYVRSGLVGSGVGRGSSGPCRGRWVDIDLPGPAEQ